MVLWSDGEKLTRICQPKVWACTQIRTDLGKSYAHVLLDPPLHLLVCFVSQEHDGNVLSSTLLWRNKIRECRPNTDSVNLILMKKISPVTLVQRKADIPSVDKSRNLQLKPHKVAAEGNLRNDIPAQNLWNKIFDRLTFTLVSHCLTAVKLCSAVMSYITITPSALRKNCLVMLRYLQGEREDCCHWQLINPWNLPLYSLIKTQEPESEVKLFVWAVSCCFVHYNTGQRSFISHLSCPAVSHICSATWLLSTDIVFTL